MALVLVVGDAFHLIPRMLVILKGEEEKYRKYLGRGKPITSISMTIFYIILWLLGFLVSGKDYHNFWTILVIGFGLVRIFICLLPHNKWEDIDSPVEWGIIRNILFLLQAIIVVGFYFIYIREFKYLSLMWFAIILSFTFYLPVVLWVNKKPMIGMLMLPKTCTYLWILTMYMLYIKST